MELLGLHWIYSVEGWISLATLAVMEIVLGIDNIVFISVLAGRLPQAEQATARTYGLLGATVTRLVLIFSVAWLASLTTPLFYLLGMPFSGKALILFVGGLFLLYKSTSEIHHKLEGAREAFAASRKGKLVNIVLQIMLIDVVFSLDSVITAVGMTSVVSIMVCANILALAVMLLASRRVSEFIEKHPSVKMLALSFLLLIGSMLVAESLGQKIPKGYIYFAMAFSLFVEFLNIRLRTSTKSDQEKPVQLLNVPRL